MKIFSTSFFITLCLLISQKQHAWAFLPADITCLVIDLKYNQKQGVKICEMQPLSESRLEGYDFLNKRNNLLQDKFCQIIQMYHPQGPYWFFGLNICDYGFRKKMLEYGWKGILYENLTIQQIFQQKGEILSNPFNLKNYEGIVYLKPIKSEIINRVNVSYRDIFLLSVEDFYEQYPNLLLLDAAFFPYLNDKYLVNQLLDSSPLKPKWNCYEKKYTSKLAEKIMQDIEGDIFVIKPRTLSRGQGVFIVHKKDLDQTLKVILNEEKICPNHPLKSLYMGWFRDKMDTFLVEEFIKSDPIFVESLNNEFYDPTMRVVVILSYHNHQVKIDFLDGYWKLPRYSINSPSLSLDDQHKSYGKKPYFCKVASETLIDVENNLKESLKSIYEKMLGIH